MSILEKVPSVEKLSADEKWQLANELWEEVEAENSAFPVRNDHVKLLQDRWTEFTEAPEQTKSWDSIKERIGKTS